MLNCAEMKIIIKLYIAENSCDVKAAHETALAITASLPASEGEVLIFNDLLLQGSVDLPSVALLLQQSSFSSSSYQTTMRHLCFTFASTENNANEISTSFHSSQV